jgi:ribonuclease VapC
MALIVFDASAVLALLRGEHGADVVAGYVGDAIMSAVNLQEVVKTLLRGGAPMEVAKEMIAELHLDIRSHTNIEAFAAAELYKATQSIGSGLGDRTCMALAITAGIPALTADRAWASLRVEGLQVRIIR